MKRGISPLIATVLLLGFTIALAAVIINWGQGFTKGIQQQTEETSNIKIACASDVAFGISLACVSGSDIKVTIKNDGAKNIEKFSYRLYNSPSDVSTGSVNTSLEAFGIKTYTLTGVAAGVKQVEFVPVITLKGKQVTCSSNTEKYGDAEGTATLSSC